MNKNILLDVYLDNNIGDDLMLMLFLDYFNDVEFLIINHNPFIKDTFKNYNNLKFLDSINDINYEEVSSYISIGGSIFNNTLSIKGKILRFKRLLQIKNLKKYNIKIMTIGSNLGPFKDPLGKMLVKKELTYNSLVSVRDNYSYNFFKHNNKFLYDDIVIGLEKSIINPMTSVIKGTMGISVHNNKKESLNYKSVIEISKSINYLLENNTIKNIKLFNFDIFNENDSKISNLIIEKVDSKFREKIRIINYTGTNMQEFLFEYKQCEYICGVRFHSLILSSVFNQKYLGYSYSNKMLDYSTIRNYKNVKALEKMNSIDITNLENYEINKYKLEDINEHFKKVEEMLYVPKKITN